MVEYIIDFVVDVVRFVEVDFDLWFVYDFDLNVVVFWYVFDYG